VLQTGFGNELMIISKDQKMLLYGQLQEDLIIYSLMESPDAQNYKGFCLVAMRQERRLTEPRKSSCSR